MNKTIMFLGLLAVSFANAQEGRVGVNTDQPSATLNVKTKVDAKTPKNLELENQVGTKLVTVLNNGKVGIGTETPKEQLHVMGAIRTQRNDKFGGYLEFVNSTKAGTGNENKAATWTIYNMTSPYVDGLHFWGYSEVGTKPMSALQPSMILADTGNIAIGLRTAPQEQLHIGSGNVRINTLPSHKGSATDKIVVVDTDGVLKSIDRNGIGGSTDENEWVYEDSTKRINLKRSGTQEMSNSSIFYNQNGAYINSNMLNETTAYFDTNTKTIQKDVAIEYDKLANNLLLKKITSDTYLPLDSRGIYTLSLNANSMYVENTKDDGKNIILTGQSTTLDTAPTNTKNYFQLRGAKTNVSHSGTGDAKYIIASYSDARLERGKSTGYVYGGRFTASYATDQSSTYQTGIQIFNQVLNSAGGTINNMEGINAYMSIANGNALVIRELKGLSITRRLDPQASLNVTNAIGLHYEGIDATKLSNTTLTNNYGIKIGDIKGANITNYAIHTGEGKIHFGDEVEVKGSIKVANSTDDACDTTKAGTIRFDATNKKFQGCTGTDWKDLHN